MKIYLMLKGLWDTVASGSGVTATEEQQAHAVIVLNLSESLLMQGVHTISAQESWTVLPRYYHTQDMASRLWLMRSLRHSIQGDGHQSARDTDSPTRDGNEKIQLRSKWEDVCSTMIRSLAASYESLVQAFRLRAARFN